MHYVRDEINHYYAFEASAWDHFLMKNTGSPGLSKITTINIIPTGLPYCLVSLTQSNRSRVYDVRDIPYFLSVTTIKGSAKPPSDPGDEQPCAPAPFTKPMNTYRVTQRRNNGTTYESQRDAYSVGDCFGDPALVRADEIISIELIRRG